MVQGFNTVAVFLTHVTCVIAMETKQFMKQKIAMPYLGGFHPQQILNYSPGIAFDHSSPEIQRLVRYNYSSVHGACADVCCNGTDLFTSI